MTTRLYPLIYVLLVAGVVIAGFGFHSPTLVAALVFGFIVVSATRLPSNGPSGRRFTRQLVGTAVLLMFFVGGFNYVVNPLGIYPTKFIEPILFSSRNSKMSLYQDYPVTPQALILGSSRAFTVDPQQVEQLWGYPAFNAAVTAGTIPDDLAFTRFAMQTRGAPRLLILCLPPEVFFTSNIRAEDPNAHLWDYLSGDSRFQDWATLFDYFTRLFSLEQTQASVRSLQTPRTQRHFEIEADGLVHYTPFIALDRAVRDSATLWAASYRSSNWDNSTVDMFQQLLELARAQGIRVIGYLPPYHPQARPTFEAQSELSLLQARVIELLRQFQTRYDFRFVDFSNPDTFTADESLFYDAVHPAEAASRLMMQALYDELG